MALSGDYKQYIFLDSSHRDRTKFPNSSRFDVYMKSQEEKSPSDPVGKAFVLYQSLITSYTSAPVDFVTLNTPINEQFFENNLISKYVEILDPLTLTIRGTANVAGVNFPLNTVNPYDRIYLTNSISGVLPGDMIYIRQITSMPKFRFISLAAYVIGTTSIVITGGSSTTGDYVGSYLAVTTVPFQLSSYRIVAYNGATKIATISPGLNAFAIIGSVIEIYEVLDNDPGLSSPGSIRGSAVNYEIRLEWIRIPRQPLFVFDLNSPGVVDPASSDKLINNSPYIYITFKNKTSGSSNVIQSNNKNTRASQFIIPVDSTNTELYKFFTLSSGYTITTKFNPTEPIEFGVYLPNGSLVIFDPNDERYGLTVPNTDLQISALFSIKREIQ